MLKHTHAREYEIGVARICQSCGTLSKLADDHSLNVLGEIKTRVKDVPYNRTLVFLREDADRDFSATCYHEYAGAPAALAMLAEMSLPEHRDDLVVWVGDVRPLLIVEPVPGHHLIVSPGFSESSGWPLAFRFLKAGRDIPGSLYRVLFARKLR